MEKLKVIVCGTTFGQYYIRALKAMPDQFDLVGLYATGSERSRKCSEFFQVPLCTDFASLPKIDLACVVIRSRAIGGNGTQIAEEFLKHKINVIQEQPIHPKDLEVCYRAAKENNVIFQTCDLYPNLLEVKRFIKCAQWLNSIAEPLYVKAGFSPQVSYPAMDILSRILPSIHTWKVNNLSKRIGPFDILTGQLGKTPIVLEYHNEVNPKDPDNYMHLLHNISIVYPSGRLTLEDTFGPVLWKPKMHVPKELYTPSREPLYPPYVLENTMEQIGEFRKRNFMAVLTNEWPIAIGADILNIRDKILNKENMNQRAQQELLRSKKWSEMTKFLGYAELINDDNHYYVPFEDLRKHSLEE